MSARVLRARPVRGGSRAVPEYLRPVVTFCYLTGWRVFSEVLPLQTSQVDLDAGVVRLDVGTTKNDEGRDFFFKDDRGNVVRTELNDLLAEQLASAERVFRETSRIVTYVFHRRDGKPIKDFRGAWEKACEDAGYPGKLLHDFRRTAGRNLVRAGVSEKVAMEMIGHKTRSIFDRYNISSERDRREAAAKLNAFATAKPAESNASGQVKQFPKAAAN